VLESTVQIAGVSELYDTGKPDVAVALTLTPLAPTVTPVGFGAKSIVWAFSPTTTFWWTCGAAFQVPPPAWSASMVQVPAAMSVRAPVVEPTVQIDVVAELYVTGRPEVAVALTLTPLAPTVTPVGFGAKSIVWFCPAAAAIGAVRVRAIITKAPTPAVRPNGRLLHILRNKDQVPPTNRTDERDDMTPTISEWPPRESPWTLPIQAGWRGIVAAIRKTV
jgi:hypothetical protein